MCSVILVRYAVIVATMIECTSVEKVFCEMLGPDHDVISVFSDCLERCCVVYVRVCTLTRLDVNFKHS